MTTRLEQLSAEMGLEEKILCADVVLLQNAARLDAEDAYRRGVDDSIRTIGEAATAMGVCSLDDQVKVALIRIEKLKEGNGNG